MSRKTESYKKNPSGYVVVVDMFQNMIEYVDCSAGGAQEALAALFTKYQHDGWTLEGRIFDGQFARRGSERVRIDIRPFDPTKETPHQRLRFD